jgi:hypothetical protein
MSNTNDSRYYLCWKPYVTHGYFEWEAIKYQNGSDYILTVIKCNLYLIILTNIAEELAKLPEIVEFSHEYKSTVQPNDELWFSFTNNSTSEFKNVVPSHNEKNPVQKGAIYVYCIPTHQAENINIGIEYGKVFKYEKFDHSSQNPNQGFIQCGKDGKQQGKCYINLDISLCSFIEIKFFSNSFSYKSGSKRFYLFGDRNDVKPVHKHILFVSYLDKIIFNYSESYYYIVHAKFWAKDK